MTSNDIDFGSILKLFRANHNLSQDDAAQRLGISRTYLSEIERGEKNNVSFALGIKMLNLNGRPHKTVEVTLPRRFFIDAPIAREILWLNEQGIVTEWSCKGPPPTALIRPSSAAHARVLGYHPELQDKGLFEIALKSSVD